jgi:cytoskeleton protein RodZ
VADHRSLDPATRLRQARENKGLSKRQVAEATKLSVRAIELLEGDSLSGLPNGIYRKSIVRAVAREVGLNPEQLLNEFATLHPDDLPSTPKVAVVSPQATTSINKVMALVSAALPMVAGLAYFAMPVSRAMLSQKPEPAAQVRQQTESRSARPMQAEIIPVGGFKEAAIVNTRPVPVVVTLTISSRCQLRVVADGAEIVGRTMEQGETLPIELGDELVLLGDNASAVQFSINGQAGRLLGEPGDVLSTRIGRDDYQEFLVRY